MLSRKRRDARARATFRDSARPRPGDDVKSVAARPGPAATVRGLPVCRPARGTPITRRPVLRALPVLVATSWLALVAAGYMAAMRYESRPGTAASPPAAWPTDTGLELATDRCTLLVFVHPQCPCSAATIEELNRLVTAHGQRLQVHVLCYDDPSLGHAFPQSDVRAAAARIPGVQVVADRGGLLARQFGVYTSGEALLFRPEGLLVFAGGITPSRGHAGDNHGSESIAAALEGRPTDQVARAPTFGCAIREPDCCSEAPEAGR